MAEAVVFSLASKILSAIASPALKKAYEKGNSIWEARDDLAKLQVSVETIHAVLLDAERKQESSVAVRNWIKRIKSVLYDAEDLFDEFATEDLIKQQMMEGKSKLSKNKLSLAKVRVYCSKLNPVVSRNSVAKKVKDIRERFAEISTDMAHFQFVRCLDEKPVYNMGRGEDRGCFVDAKSVIGRDKDKRVMLDMIINGSDSARSNSPTVLAIVGIGGMGKTTLAQLIFNDEKIRSTFQNKWFACISDITDEKEVLGKIFQSIKGVSYSDLNVGQLQTEIRKSVENQKCLLVLDDVWEEDHARWQDRISLLSSRARESRIIVTTRSPSVAKAVGALRPHNLEGLSEDDSWSLFKKSAFVEEYENDPRRESLGKQILKKCSGVPLAIRSIGSLLYSNNTIEEWVAIEKVDLPVLGRKHNDETMRVLKLSYDHLPSNLKQCFAYCCLFPKDYRYNKRDLINHWIAQGYVDPDDEESSFMHLLRRGFFQEAYEGNCGEIKSCKMHDLMHDLATYVAGEEIIVPSSGLSCTSSCARHGSFKISNSEESLDIFTLVLNAKSLRSLLLATPWYRFESSKLDQIFASVKLLRTLSLGSMKIENIPPSIGELKLLRHLDLSGNVFEDLPQSVADLVNLLSLNLERCKKFKVWPHNFHKLSNLRYLNIEECDKLRSMPTEIEKMTHLQYLSNFKTEKGNECLNSSAGLLQQLRGELSIEIISYGSYEDGDDGNWQLPVSLHQLEISGYQGMRIRGGEDFGRQSNLVRLKLTRCMKVKYLPPFSCLPNLKDLSLDELEELEFIEEEEHGSTFFPCLDYLYLDDLPNLKRWWRKVAAGGTNVEFPHLRILSVRKCQHLELDSFPLFPHLNELEVSNAISRTKWQLNLGSLRHLEIRGCPTLKSLELSSTQLQLESMSIYGCNALLSIELVVSQHLQRISIMFCSELKSIELVEAQAPASSRLSLEWCDNLESLRASAQLIAGVEELRILRCNKLRLEMLGVPSPTALNHLGGCIWRVEALRVDDIEIIEKLSWLPIQEVTLSFLSMPIMFPAAPLTSLRSIIIEDANGLENLQLDGSPLLQEAYIHNCGRLTSVEVKAPIRIQISGCPALKNLRIADPSALKEFETEGCPELEELYKHELATTQRVVPFQLRSGSGITIKRRSSEAPHISVADVSWSSDSDLYISPPSSQELKRRSSEAARISVADFYQVSWSSDSHLDLCSEIEL